MKRIRILLALGCALCAAYAGAQSLESFKTQLAQPESSEMLRLAVVEVHEQGDAADAVRLAGEQTARIRFKGYRVGIFFDNGENARAKAAAARDAFAAAYPDVRVYMVYENPYFKVSAGDCVTSEEAIVLLGRIRTAFPDAYLMREEMSAADLVR